ncbi:MAG: hypothetical protein HY902_01175 [Deltaproteobacteria bacterium]|nr:hypothetical protein [Deltaproteobacteria bacterium]
MFTLACAAASSAHAADESIVPEELRKDVLPAKPKAGAFNNTLSIGSTGSYGHSSSVVGAADGSTVAIGVVIDGLSEWVSGAFECANTLKIQHTQTRTPQLPVFFKSADFAEIVSTSIYRLQSVPWFGPYARFRINTQLFGSYVLKATDYEIKQTRLDGTSTATKLAAQTRYDLASGFNPLVFAETVGAFANPIEQKWMTIKAKLGVGAQHVRSTSGFAVASDDTKAGKMEIKEIQEASQMGGEAEVALAGDVTEGVAWKAKANVFLPAYSTAGKKTGFDAMTSDLSFALGIKLAKWLSVDYTVTARRVPLVLDDWQIQNGIILTAGFKL